MSNETVINRRRMNAALSNPLTTMRDVGIGEDKSGKIGKTFVNEQKVNLHKSP